jgi:hypothetical protein
MVRKARIACVWIYRTHLSPRTFSTKLQRIWFSDF